MSAPSFTPPNPQRLLQKGVFCVALSTVGVSIPLVPTTSAGLIACLLVCNISIAADRLTVITPRSGQERAENLAQSVAAACNAGDYIAFIGHFTPAHRQRCRTSNEKMFINGHPLMEIRKVTLLSEESDQLIFAVKYAWHDRDSHEKVYASKVTARLIGNDWRIDGETVKFVTGVGSACGHTSESVGDSDLPQEWDPFSPPKHLISPNLEHLRGDIGIRPGLGCANGRCGKQ